MYPLNFMQPSSVYAAQAFQASLAPHQVIAAPHAATVPHGTPNEHGSNTLMGKYWGWLLAGASGVAALTMHKLPFLKNVKDTTIKENKELFAKISEYANGIKEKASPILEKIGKRKNNAEATLPKSLSKKEKKEISSFLKKTKKLSPEGLLESYNKALDTGKYPDGSDALLKLNKKYRIALRRAEATERATAQAPIGAP